MSNVVTAGKAIEDLLAQFDDDHKPKVCVAGPGQEGPDESVYFFAALNSQDKIELKILDSIPENLERCRISIKDMLKMNSLKKEPEYVSGNFFSIDETLSGQDMIFYHDVLSMLPIEEDVANLIGSTRKALSRNGKGVFVFLDYGNNIEDRYIRCFSRGHWNARKILGKDAAETEIMNDYSTSLRKAEKSVMHRIEQGHVVLSPMKRCNRLIYFGR